MLGDPHPQRLGRASNCVAVLLALVWVCIPCRGAELPPELASLLDAASKTLKRVEQEPVSWKTTVGHDVDGKVFIETTASPAGIARKLSSNLYGPTAELLRILERDGRWWVQEKNGIRGIYQPFAAPFHASFAYEMLNQSTPEWVTREMLLKVQEFRPVDGLLELKFPISEQDQERLVTAIKGIDRLRSEHPPKNAQTKAELQETRSRLVTLLNRGYWITVDPSTGVIIEKGEKGRRVRVSALEFKEATDPNTFLEAGAEFEDHSKPLVQDELNDWTMFMHNHERYWKQNVNSSDVVLLNVRTGELRRVPCRAKQAMPSFFLPSHRKAVLVAMEDGFIGYREVDLLTGENRNISPNLSMMPFGGALSEDGRELAFQLLVNSSPHRTLQAYRMALDTGEMSPVGEPFDQSFLSWAPSQRGFLIVKREFIAADKPGMATIGFLGFDGVFSPIRRNAESPLALPDRKTIAFEDVESRTFMTCDLNGKLRQPLLNEKHELTRGLSVSPDGTRLLAVEVERPAGRPWPVIIDIKTRNLKRISDRPGLWTHPVWH